MNVSLPASFPPGPRKKNSHVMLQHFQAWGALAATLLPPNAPGVLHFPAKEAEKRCWGDRIWWFPVAELRKPIEKPYSLMENQWLYCIVSILVNWKCGLRQRCFGICHVIYVYIPLFDFNNGHCCLYLGLCRPPSFENGLAWSGKVASPAALSLGPYQATVFGDFSRLVDERFRFFDSQVYAAAMRVVLSQVKKWPCTFVLPLGAWSGQLGQRPLLHGHFSAVLISCGEEDLPNGARLTHFKMQQRYISLEVQGLKKNVLMKIRRKWIKKERPCKILMMYLLRSRTSKGTLL